LWVFGTQQGYQLEIYHIRLGSQVARLGKKAIKKTKTISNIQYGTDPKNILPSVASGSETLPFTV
tara:strand:+ start:647 stop:841 length:195 start_codon:yes stop_codon:yes gene_type:complete